MSAAGVFDQILQSVLQTKTVQRQRAQLADQLMHLFVNRIGTFNHHARGVFGVCIHPFGAVHHGLTQAFDGSDLLAKFVMQFAGDLAAHLFNAALNHLGEFAVLHQCQVGFTRLGLRGNAFLHRLRHGVKGFTHDPRFLAFHRGQPCVVTAALHGLQALHHLLQRLHGATHQHIHQCNA